MTSSDTRQRRITERLFILWDNLRGDVQFPTISALTEEALGNLWPDCFIVEASMPQNIGSGSFTHIGKHIMRIFPQLPDSPEDLPYPEHFISSLTQVIDTLHPVVDEGEIMYGDHIKRYRQILLPVGKDNVITHILGGMREKNYRDVMIS